MPRIDKNEPLYLIGVAARLCELHPQTLRMYERLGLVRPARIGRKNRVYSEADIERLRQIQRLTQDMGVNLAGVEVILDLLDKMQRMQEQMDAEMERMQQIMEEKLGRLQK
ncbi:MAG: MerR family transcriptional regulator [Armatimonadota bacterium]|nr:MerR family transcriptional regulator [bacterium]